MSEFTGIYRGAVFDIDDPERRGRLRLLIPVVLGESPSAWAEPALPTAEIANWAVGDRVWVLFEGGDLTRPAYISRMEVQSADIAPGAVGSDALSDEVKDELGGGGSTSDGLPPASSPTPDALGMKGGVFLRWTPVLNADMVTYEIHVSTVDGFAATPETKVGETVGSMVVVSVLPDGSPLANNTTYYFRLIATDADGAASAGGQTPGSPGLVGLADLEAALDAKIDTAFTTANSKNTVHHKTFAPTNESNAAGDTWFQYDGANNIVAQFRGAGGESWVQESLGHQVIGSLDLGKATVGSLSGEKITANTMQVDRLLVADMTDFINDPHFAQALGLTWTAAAGSPTVANAVTGPSGATDTAARFTLVNGAAQQLTQVARMKVTPGDEISLSIKTRWHTVAPTSGVYYFGVILRDQGGNAVSTQYPIQLSYTTLSTDWFEQTAKFTIPADVISIQPVVRVSSTFNTGVVVEFTHAKIKRRLPGSLVVDGTIGVDQLAASSVTAEKMASLVSLSNLFTTRGLDANGVPIGAGIDIGNTPVGSGLFTYDSAGVAEVSMPTSGKKVWRGDAEIDYLTVKTLTTLLSTSLAEGATFTLEQGITNPGVTPTMYGYFNSSGIYGTSNMLYGFVRHPDDVHYFTYTPNFNKIQKKSLSNNSVVGESFSGLINTGSSVAMCKGGGWIWVLEQVSPYSSYKVHRFTYDLARWDVYTLSWGSVTNRPQKLPAIKYVGTGAGTDEFNIDLVFAQDASGGGTAGTLWRQRFLYTGSGGGTPGVVAVSGQGVGGAITYNYDLAGVEEVAADFGTTRMVYIRRGAWTFDDANGFYAGYDINVATNTLSATVPNENWVSATDKGIVGLEYNAATGRFEALNGEGFRRDYSKMFWSNNSNKYETWYAAYTWRDPANSKETRRSPYVSFLQYKRGNLSASVPGAPSGVTGVGWFLSRTQPATTLPSGTTQSMTRQFNRDSTPSLGFDWTKDINGTPVFTPNNDPTTNSFIQGSGNPATVRSYATDAYGPLINLRGDGEARSISLMPVGAIIEWPHETLPDNSWLWADGGTFLQADYPELYVKLGNTTTKPTRNAKWLEAATITSGVLSALSGWSVSAQEFTMLDNNMVHADFTYTRTGTTISLANPDHSNQQMGSITVSKWTPIYGMQFPDSGLRHVLIAAGGAISIVSGLNGASVSNANIQQNQTFRVQGMWKVDPPTSAPRIRYMLKAR